MTTILPCPVCGATREAGPSPSCPNLECSSHYKPQRMTVNSGTAMPQGTYACVPVAEYDALKAANEYLLNLLCLADLTIIPMLGAYPYEGSHYRKTCDLIRAQTGGSYDGRVARANRALGKD